MKKPLLFGLYVFSEASKEASGIKRENSSILALVVVSGLPVAWEQPPDRVIRRRKKAVKLAENFALFFSPSPATLPQTTIPRDF